MRCNVCAHLDLEALLTYSGPVPYHHNLSQLRQAARDGCDLCKLVEYNAQFRSAEKAAQRFPEDAGQGLWLEREAPEDDAFARNYDRLICFNEDRTEMSFLPILDNQNDSTTDLDRVQVLSLWLKTCQYEHRGCQLRRNISMTTTTHPARLIALGHHQDGLHCRLVETGGRNIEYAILSYKWGEAAHAHQTTKQNYPARMNRIPVADMAKTWKDAIELCIQLGLSYIWIDALCIIQPTDSSDDLDWQTESAKMGSIYEQAILAISACSATSSSQGCLPPNHDGLVARIPSPCHLVPHQHENNVLLRPYLPLWNATIETCPLQERGWVLQESQFAQRQVLCTQYGIFWRCSELRAHESMPLTPYNVYDGALTLSYGTWYVGDDMAQQSIGKHGLTLPSPLTITDDEKLRLVTEYWTTVVVDYANRQLTKETDRFPAISAVARRIKELTGDTYMAGIWQSQLNYQLKWSYTSASHTPEIARKRKLLHKVEAQPNFIGPSWSWVTESYKYAAGRADLLFETSGRGSTRSNFAKLISTDLQPVFKENPFGALQPGARLTLRAQVLHYDARIAREGRSSRFWSHDDGFYIDAEPSFGVWWDEQPKECDLIVLWTDDHKITESPLTWRCLVVLPVHGSKDTFKRINTCSWTNDVFKHAEERTIHLI